MSVLVRAAAPADLPAILAIEQAAPTAAHWTAAQYRARLEDGYLLVAEREGKICGFLCARIAAGEWEIENVVVKKGSKRQGVGDHLMRALLQKWDESAGSAILLEVRQSNVAARALYVKHGLSEVGRRRSYYRDPVEDAILYNRRRAK
jgi:ribosomal-protein-alanine N-acetyltransferase